MLKRVFVVVMSALFFVGALDLPANASDFRIYGENREKTSEYLATRMETYNQKMGRWDFNVLVSDGYRGLAEALSAVPYAAYMHYPLRLRLIPPSQPFFTRAKPYKDSQGQWATQKLQFVWITGGELPDPTIHGIQNFAGDLDRYALSVKFAEQLPDPNCLFVINGDAYADALSAAPFAAYAHVPILFVKQDSVPQVVSNYVNAHRNTIKTTYIIGGTGVISDTVMNQFPNPVRLGGTDRYQTCLQINKTLPSIFFPKKRTVNFYLVSGDDDHLADAISAAPNANLYSEDSMTLFLLVPLQGFPYTDHNLFDILKPIAKNSPDRLFSAMVDFSIGGPAVIPDKTINTANILIGRIWDFISQALSAPPGTSIYTYWSDGTKSDW